MDKLEYNQVIITLIFLSYPIIYCFDRGNLEALVFIVLSFSILLFSREKYGLSALFLACAAGIKFYPIIFGLLFIKRKRYKEFALFLLIGLLITLASLASLHGGFAENLHICIANTKAVSNGSFMMSGVRQSSSLMAGIKILYVQIQSLSHIVNFSEFTHFVYWLSPLYSIGSLVVIFFYSVYIIFFENVFWKQVMILTLLMILLPAVSYDYKLIHLFIPLVFFLQDNSPLKTTFAKLYVMMFSLLLIPKNYYIFSLTVQNYLEGSPDGKVSMSVFANILIILSFLIVIVIEKIHQKK